MGLELAEAAAQNATCLTRPVGAVVISAEGKVVTGYEGAPSGHVHCNTFGCHLVDGHCQNAVRAEVNAVVRCARAAIATDQGTLYVSAPVDASVVGALINAGICLVVCPAPVSAGARAALQMGGVALKEEIK